MDLCGRDPIFFVVYQRISHDRYHRARVQLRSGYLRNGAEAEVDILPRRSAAGRIVNRRETRGVAPLLSRGQYTTFDSWRSKCPL